MFEGFLHDFDPIRDDPSQDDEAIQEVIKKVVLCVNQDQL